MDSCENVQKEIDKLIAKFGNIKEYNNRTLQDLCDHIQNLKQEYDECAQDYQPTDKQIGILNEVMSKVRETANRISAEHKELHGAVSKVGKAIDKNFIADFGICGKPDLFTSPEEVKLIDQVICQHFYRQGMVDIAEKLAQEAKLTIAEQETRPFVEMNKMLTHLKNKELDPVLDWVCANKEKLDAMNSSLEFMIHRLRFIMLMQKGASHQAESLFYARTYFAPFADRHEREIQNLMGMFLYLPSGVKDSPYSRYLEPVLWLEIIDIFTRDACTLMGFSVESPLSISMKAGCKALPALLNLKQVMQQRNVAGIWSGKDELPIEIDVGEERYHSTFACPILRQQSSDTNPPMRLVCGHVISKDALAKLSNTANKLKCPYCPVEQSTSDAKLIHF